MRTRQTVLRSFLVFASPGLVKSQQRKQSTLHFLIFFPLYSILKNTHMHGSRFYKILVKTGAYFYHVRFSGTSFMLYCYRTVFVVLVPSKRHNLEKKSLQKREEIFSEHGKQILKITHSFTLPFRHDASPVKLWNH